MGVLKKTLAFAGWPKQHAVRFAFALRRVVFPKGVREGLGACDAGGFEVSPCSVSASASASASESVKFYASQAKKGCEEGEPAL